MDRQAYIKCICIEVKDVAYLRTVLFDRILKYRSVWPRRNFLSSFYLKNIRFSNIEIVTFTIIYFFYQLLRFRCTIKNLVDEVMIFNLTQAWKDCWFSGVVYNHKFIIDLTLKVNGFELLRKFETLLN